MVRKSLSDAGLSRRLRADDSKAIGFFETRRKSRLSFSMRARPRPSSFARSIARHSREPSSSDECAPAARQLSSSEESASMRSSRFCSSARRASDAC